MFYALLRPVVEYYPDHVHTTWYIRVVAPPSTWQGRESIPHRE